MAFITDAPIEQRVWLFTIIVILVAFAFVLFRVWYQIFEKIYDRIVPKKHQAAIWPSFLWALGISIPFIGLTILVGVLPV